MIRRVAKTAVGTKTGRRASTKAIKAAAGTRTGRKALKAGAKSAGKAGLRAGKVGVKAGKVGAKHKASNVGTPTASRGWMKFGLVAVAGFALGALFGRSKSDGASSDYTSTTGHHSPDAGSPAGQRGQTWGSGSSLNNAGGGAGTTGGASSGGSAMGPTSAPLIGEQRGPQTDIATERQQEVEQRVKTRLGEDSRTQGMPRVNVEVNDGIADLRGPAPTEAAKQAVGEIALATEGVREVRNLMTVGE